MNTKKLKEEISTILVKWNMPTRQVVINEIISLIESALTEQKKEIVEKIKGRYKKRLYHWMKFEDDESDKFEEGIVNDHVLVPEMADFQSSEYVWNKALDDILEELKK